MGKEEVREFLNHLAVSENVSAYTQNQALCAIVFLYKHALKNGAFLKIITGYRLRSAGLLSIFH